MVIWEEIAAGVDNDAIRLRVAPAPRDRSSEFASVTGRKEMMKARAATLARPKTVCACSLRRRIMDNRTNQKQSAISIGSATRKPLEE